jgi:hypothetical protein
MKGTSPLLVTSVTFTILLAINTLPAGKAVVSYAFFVYGTVRIWVVGVFTCPLV